MSKRIWFISMLLLLVSAALTAGFSPAAQAQNVTPVDNPASAYNNVPPQTGYYCPMGTGYPNMTNSPKPGYKTNSFKRGGHRGSWDYGQQGYSGPHRMGCSWY